jgi:phosphatidylserine decarboxylase
MSIAKDGYPFILGLAVPAAVCFALSLPWVGGALMGLALFTAFFFRDPERNVQASAGQVLAPADGKVLSVRNENGQEALSIFLSIFDVHINRAPIGGRITKIEYKPGKFRIAYDERASSENEQNSITIERDGTMVRCVQITGLIARRIVCWKKEGDTLAAGERIGLMRFGSRMDVFMPAGSKIQVRAGDRVRGGLTVVGELP